MVIAWCGHNHSMVWSYYGVVMVIVWCGHGHGMVWSWSWYGVVMVMVWCGHGQRLQKKVAGWFRVRICTQNPLINVAIT